MSSQFSPTTTRTDNSRPSSPLPDALPSDPLHLPQEDSTDSPSPTSPRSSVVASPPLNNRPYSPHVVGIGILSPQPVFGPFAPISRANLAPLHVRSSPAEQRSNPDSAISPRTTSGPYDPPPPRASGSRSPETLQLPPPLPSAPSHTEPVSTNLKNDSEHISLTTFSSPSSGQSGLRISIPPPNPTTSTSTPSPPLFLPPTQDPVASSISSALDPGLPGAPFDNPAPAPAGELIAPSTELNIDVTEFDTEGYSALEKFYLFARSAATFRKVFIAHALPKYLLGADIPAAEQPSREIIEQITPSEAVEYVLPMLRHLATDEEESVKEALAAELVPIIWWFITHCRLIEDDELVPPSPPAPTPLEDATELPGEITGREDQDGAPVVLPVQAFTPILGILLLSPNGIVGGSARYAVVELLRRIQRADQRGDMSMSESLGEAVETADRMGATSPTPSQAEYQDTEAGLDIGYFHREERRMFEHELIHQVVLGMGRLDVDDTRTDQDTETFDEVASNSDVSTAVPTPHINTLTTKGDSYFPATAAAAAATPTSFSASSHPTTTAPEASTAIGMLPPIPSPSPPVSSTSSMSGSPGTSVSTPSLTSSTSSSSGEYPDNGDHDDSDGFDIHLKGSFCVADDVQVPMDALTTPEAKMFGAPSWPDPTVRRHVALPTTPPFEIPPPPVAVPHTTDTSLPLAGLPLLQVQAPIANPAREGPTSQISGWLSPTSAARELAAMDEQQQVDDGSDLSEEAAVGRLSSMSLMAAVTASGSIGEDTKTVFVAEVERVGRDPVYWVRREASFAVGALAKVVPVEVVTASLLPLFEVLCHDPTWHVRHSVLFALPAILSRLTPEHRRKLALDVILPLSQDEEYKVRSAVMEALGEVMYTFAEDKGGPPEPLLKLFLGIRETDDPGGSQIIRQNAPVHVQPPSLPRSTNPASATSSAWSDYGTDAGSGPDIYDDPQRPLVCAFNYPAATLTLGKDRWHQLRPLYLSLVHDPTCNIRRTLAASLGEIAKIIGEDQARADLVDVFLACLRAEESEVRMKVIEALQTFVRALAKRDRADIARALENAFSSGKLSSWRERENAVRVLGGLVEVEGIEGEVLRKMLVKGLNDRVAAVREAAVAAMPAFMKAWKGSPTLLEELHSDVRAFAGSESFRGRTTYVACIQKLLAADAGDMVVQRGMLWEILARLAKDPIMDVRIRVARLVGLISDTFGRDDSEVATKAVALARELAEDSSQEVVAFATAVLAGDSLPGSAPTTRSPPSGMATLPLASRISKTAEMFSRPPPPPNPS